MCYSSINWLYSLQYALWITEAATGIVNNDFARCPIRIVNGGYAGRITESFGQPFQNQAST